MSEDKPRFRKRNKPYYKTQKPFCLDERRAITAHLYLTGNFTYTAIAQYLKDRGIPTSNATVSADIKVMQKHWRDSASASMDTMIHAEMAKLNAWEQECVEELMAEDISRADFVDVMLKIAKRRAELLGLDKQKKFEITHKEGSLKNLTMAELNAMLQELPKELVEQAIEKRSGGAKP